jgi:hypothetical protein
VPITEEEFGEADLGDAMLSSRINEILSFWNFAVNIIINRYVYKS